MDHTFAVVLARKLIEPLDCFQILSVTGRPEFRISLADIVADKARICTHLAAEQAPAERRTLQWRSSARDNRAVLLFRCRAQINYRVAAPCAVAQLCRKRSAAERSNCSPQSLESYLIDRVHRVSPPFLRWAQAGRANGLGRYRCSPFAGVAKNPLLLAAGGFLPSFDTSNHFPIPSPPLSQ